MSDFTKVLTLIVAGGIVTTLVYPGRQTPAIVEKFWNGFNGSIKVMTGR